MSTLIGSSGDPVLVNDGGVDDNPSDAQRVEPYADSTLRRAALTLGSISTTKDADYFRFRSPKPPPGKFFGMLVDIDALELDQLVPAVQVLDKQLKELAVEQFVNGNGNVVLWVPNVQENVDYTVRIAGATASKTTGNYEVSVAFQENKPHRNVLSVGHLTKAAPESQFALMPGTYNLQFGTKMSNALVSDFLNLELSGNADTDPVGPPPLVGSQPIFTCPDTTVQFCYRDTPPTPIPFVFVPTPAVVLPTSIPFPVTPPVDTWFWNNQFPRTNIALPADTSGDGLVSPRDALIVINYLNTFGSGLLPAPPVVLAGMIDVSGNGLVSPLDALLVINYLNRQRGLGEGEGESSPQLTFDFSAYSPDLFVVESDARNRRDWFRF